MLKSWNNKYLTSNEPFRKQVVSAILPVPDSMDIYIKQMRKIHKGNAVRLVNRANNNGFLCSLFTMQNHIEDIVEINHSKQIRQGRKMKNSYLQTVEEFGGLPNKLVPYKNPDCHLHYSQFYGVFCRIQGYKQGSLIVNKKLVGYVNLLRYGEIILYNRILGHGHYLNDGIMYLLNHAVLQWIIEIEANHKENLKCIMYGGWFDGKEGLQKWKKRTLFQPYYLKLLD